MVFGNNMDGEMKLFKTFILDTCFKLCHLERCYKTPKRYFNLTYIKNFAKIEIMYVIMCIYVKPNFAALDSRLEATKIYNAAKFTRYQQVHSK